MSTALIVGGAGFIGGHLVERLRRDGKKVLVFDNFSVFPEKRPKEACGVVIGDVRSKSDWKRALEILLIQQDAPTIFYLASKRGYGNNWTDFGSTNVGGSYTFFQALLESKLKVRRIVLSSSQAVYSPGLSKKESDAGTLDSWDGGCDAPPSVYGMTKLQQEKVFQFMVYRENSPPVVALRYCVVLGAGQSLLDKETGVLRNWYRAWKKDLPPEVYGDGQQVRDFVHVLDVVDANIAAAYTNWWDPPGGFDCFNVPGQPIKIIELARIFQKVTGCRDPILVPAKQPCGEVSITSDASYTKSFLCGGAQRDVNLMVQDFVEDMLCRQKSSTT